MIELNYDIKPGDTIIINTGLLNANITRFKSMRGDYECVVDSIGAEEQVVLCKDNVMLDLDVAAYFNGHAVGDDYELHATEHDDYLPDLKKTVLFKDGGGWETRRLLCRDYVRGLYDGLDFTWYDGGGPLVVGQRWRIINEN